MNKRADFMQWMRTRREYHDLASDGRGLRSLSALVLDMHKEAYCAAARVMLEDAATRFNATLTPDADPVLTDMDELVCWAKETVNDPAYAKLKQMRKERDSYASRC